MGRKVLTIDRCTQKKWVPDGRRSKRFTLQIYEKQRVRASSPCILFPYHPQQKHADARGVGVVGKKSAKRAHPIPLGSAAEAAGGGARASGGGTSPRSPPGEGETPRGRSKATGGSPVSDAATRGVGGSGARESPQSSTRRRSGGGRRWSTCIKRWNVATLSPRRTQGDRRKPRERRRSPKSRRVGGAGNPQSSTRRRSGGGKRWSTCIKRWNVATLSPRRRGDTARPISTQPEESAGRLPGWMRMPARPGTPSKRGSRAPQAADHRRGERAGGADIRPREWPDAPPKRAVQAWPWTIVRSRREKTAPPPCPRAGGRCGANESMWTSGKN